MTESISIRLPATRAEEAPQAASLEAYSGDVIRLYDAHSAALFRLAMAVCQDTEAARDAVQDTFVKYCVARGAGHEIHDEKAWLSRVLHNAVMDWHRERRNRGEVAMDEAATVADTAPEPEAAHLLEERLKGARSMLSPAEFRCVELRAAGMRYQEIAEAMGLRTGTIATFLFRAVRKLRHRCSDSGQ